MSEINHVEPTRLDQDLAALSGRAASAASPPGPGAVVVRAERRRARRRVAAVVVPVLAVVSVAGGVLASRGSPRGTNVAVGPGTSTATTSAPVGAQGGPLSVPAARVAPPARSGLGTCVLGGDPITGARFAAERGPLRNGPVSVSAVWIPTLPATGCRSTVTTANAAVAQSLVTALLASTRPAGQMMGCPAVVGSNVDLVFQYADAPRLAVASMHLGGCDKTQLPDGTIRSGLGASGLLSQLHPPAWLGRGGLGASTAP